MSADNVYPMSRTVTRKLPIDIKGYFYFNLFKNIYMRGTMVVSTYEEVYTNEVSQLWWRNRK